MILKVIGYLIAFSLIGCVYLAMRKHASLKGAEQCRGVVIGHVARTGSKGRTVYALEVEYTDRTGATRHFVTDNASSPPERAVGDEVVVFAHPDKSKPDILVFEELFLGYWIWFCVGVLAAGCLAAPTVLRLIYLK